MESITPVISAIFPLLAEISSMVPMTLATAPPPTPATSLARTARALACRAFSELWPTLPASCSIDAARSEEHTSELQSQSNLVCRLLLEKKKKKQRTATHS